VLENGIDLLVIVSRGIRGFTSMFWGGTAHNLTSTVRCNVLVVSSGELCRNCLL